MTIRAVTAADEAAIRGLWEAFDRELPEPDGFTPESWEEVWAAFGRHARDGVALIAEDENGPAGFAFATALRGARSHVTDLYVRPDARRHGVGTDLMRELAAGGGGLGGRGGSPRRLLANSPARTLFQRR